MAVGRSESQVTWSSANSVTIAAGASSASDAVTVNAAAVAAAIYVKVDNAGTPASGDIADIRILYSGGDVDAEPDVTDTYTTAGSAPIVARADTNAEDPVVLRIPLALPAKGVKLYVTNNGASSIIVSAQYEESTNT